MRIRASYVARVMKNKRLTRSDAIVQQMFLCSDLDPGRGHAVLGLADGVFAEMKDARGQYGIGMTLRDPVHQVIEVADAAGGDHRDTHGIAHRAREREVEAVLGAIAIHRG